MWRRFVRQPHISAYVLVSSLMIHLLGLASTIYVMQVFNRYVSYGLSSTLVTLTVGVFLALAFEFAFRIVRQHFMHALCAVPERQTVSTVAMVCARAQSGDISQEHHPRMMLQSLETWQQTYTPTNLTAIVDAPYALLFLGVVSLLSPVFGLILLGALSVALLVQVLARWQQSSLQKALRQHQAESHGIVRSFHEVDTVRAFNTATVLLPQWQRATMLLQRIRYKVASTANATQAITTSLVGVTTVGVVALGSVSVVLGDLSIGAVIGANILASRALSVLVRVIGLAPALAQGEHAHKRLGEFIQTPCERADDGIQLDHVDGRVALEGVTFGYPQASTPVLDDMDLHLKSGDVLLVTGDNGAGKTTLVRLLVGLIQPQRGHVLVNGFDLRQVDQSCWRRHLVYLPQEPRFFQGTLMANLLVARPTANQEQLLQALGAVGLGDFVRNHRDGLQMAITPQAEDLAYGVRRRLALARAILTGGKVWVLDEIAEGIDPSGIQAISRLVQQAVHSGNTVVICSSGPTVYPGAHYRLDLNRTRPSLERVEARPTSTSTSTSASTSASVSAPMPDSGHAAPAGV